MKPQSVLPDPAAQPTMSVPEAGLIFGLSRPSAYEAARKGEIPTIRIGRRVLVPTAKLLAMLGLDIRADHAPASPRQEQP